MSEKITVVDRQHRVANMATKPEFLVDKDEMLAALATVSVAISSPLTILWIDKNFKGRSQNVFAKCWQDIFKIWWGNVR